MSEFTITINWFVVLAIFGACAGVFVALFGLIGASDPEGRGGAFLPLVPIGIVIAVGCVVYLFYRLGAIVGLWP